MSRNRDALFQGREIALVWFFLYEIASNLIALKLGYL